MRNVECGMWNVADCGCNKWMHRGASLHGWCNNNECDEGVGDQPLLIIIWQKAYSGTLVGF